MRTEFHIALRYLFAKKRHNVINIISIVSAAGIAIGSMALILILSVYNGFDNSIREIYESCKADFTISPSKGKTLEVPPQILDKISLIEGVAYSCPIISDNIYVKYGKNEAIATVVGIDSLYFKWNAMAENLIEGKPTLHKGEIKQAVIGEDLARELGARVRFVTPLETFFPKKEGEFSITDPLASINMERLFPSAILRSNGNDIPKAVYTDAGTARKLLGGDENEYSGVEIYLHPESNVKEVGKKLSEILPTGIVKDKQQQNATLYKMMKAEKFAVYLILFFVIGIISINIFSCLSMLVTDKREDIATLLGMGATKGMISRIFHLHGTLISITGCTLGTIAGTVAAIIQKQFGIISLPGSFMITAYPVQIQVQDIAITFIGVSLIGFLISYLPVKKFF